MVVYIETTIKRTLGEIPKDPDWFACERADANLIGKFTEPLKTYDEFTCLYPCNADREVLQRQQQLTAMYANKTVWFKVKTVPLEDYEFEMAKLLNFQKRMAL